MEIKELKVTAENTGMRLDKLIAESSLSLSRARVQQLIESGMISLLPQRMAYAAIKVKIDDIITIKIPEPVIAAPLPQKIPIDIIYEDNFLLVINKPIGLVVHPAPGHSDFTLVNALLAHCGDSLSGIGGVKRPGIVHRLDKDTSGLMIVAKCDQSHQALTAQFADRSLSRTYQALVWGKPDLATGTVRSLIGRDPHNRQKMAVVKGNGRDAITNYKVLNKFQIGEKEQLIISLIECTLATGRTHQIRLHLRHIGCPIIGDSLYGNLRKGIKKTCPEILEFVKRQMLHATEIKFIHPYSQEPMHFSIPVANDMFSLLKYIEKNKKC